MVLLDIEMPKSCKDCRINVYGRCGALRTSVLQEMVNEERNDNCPIKAEIPRNATNGDLLLSIFQEKSDCFYPIGTRRGKGIRMESKPEMQKMIDEFEEKFYKSGLVDSFAEKVFKHGFMDGYERGYKDALNRREPLIHEPRKEDKE